MAFKQGCGCWHNRLCQIILVLERSGKIYAGNGHPAQTAGKGCVFPRSLSHFLATTADQECAATFCRGFKAGVDHGVISDGITDLAAELNTSFPPCGRDDCALDDVALDTEEGRRFVCFVQDADREQEQTDAGRRALADVKFNIGLFDFNFTRLPISLGRT